MKIIAACMAVALLWGCGARHHAAPGCHPSPSPHAASRPRPSASPSTGRRTPTTRASTSRDAKGWYAEAGIDLQVLPYATATPETLLAAHQAECGISFQDSLTFAVAAGADIVSVAAILQRTASAIGVLADGPIQRPRDLDGKTYAGLRLPERGPDPQGRHQGGRRDGRIQVATLDSAAYEALYNKKADFTIPFTAWEGVEADLRGIDLRYFRFADYGFPEFYQVVLACDREWLEREPDAARRFVAATVRASSCGVDEPGRGGRHPRRREPGRVRREHGAARASRDSSSRAVTWSTTGASSAGRRSSDGRPIPSSSSSRACWSMPPASRWPHPSTTARCSRTTICRDARISLGPPAIVRCALSRHVGALRPASRA